MNVQCFGMLKNIYDNMPSKDNAWIAGGALRSFLVADKVKDIDIFSYDVQKTLSDFRSDTSFELRNENEFIANFYKNNLCYQVIKKYSFSGPQETIDNFDFTIARVGITKESLEKNEAIADVDFKEDDSGNRLNIKNIHCPIAQIYRVSKYMEKGYWLPMRQTLKIVQDWETRPEEYKNKILEVVKKEDPTKEEIQELERLLHID